MLVFLDTEFTEFVRPDLISIALVSEDGREFYAELDDYQRDNCNAFVRKNVVPLLGRVSGAACNRAELTRRLRAWVEELPEPAIIIFDFKGDWLLLSKAMLSRQQSPPPPHLGEPLHLDSSSITHPVFEQAQRSAYTQDWPAHHALADARALMAGYRAWRAFMKNFGGFNESQ